jgi:hypothetical protein
MFPAFENARRRAALGLRDRARESAALCLCLAVVGIAVLATLPEDVARALIQNHR